MYIRLRMTMRKKRCIKIYVRECDDVNRNAKDDICKAVNKKGGLSE